MRLISTLTLVTSLVLLVSIRVAFAQDTGTATQAPAEGAAEAAATIPPGTVITAHNWQQYRQFMTDGMQAMFQGTYFWKMPPDIQMEIGPTVVEPLPRNYLAATEKYASQIKIAEPADGGLTLENYHGGIPFPAPQEPHKGWKILANLWYRYAPRLLVMSGWDCAVNSFGQRQL
jgi:hypothetical protein